MLTVFVQHDNKIVYIKPFKDHKEAIEFYAKLYDGHLYHDAVLGLTSETELNLGEPKKLDYVS